jgi:multiple sugar transport system ATP-binding protein
MSQVIVENLCIRIAANEIIQHLNLMVHEGEFLVLLGPSGCGKSTLLHAIAGLIDVNSGDVLIGQKNMTYTEPSERGIGMVFQSYALYPTMTVEQNMSFGLQVRGVPKTDIKKMVGNVANILQLESLLQRKPAQLSGGQRQRVAIGRALMRDANVFLFDEPLSNLDAKLRAELRRELKLLYKKLGATMIYVTHDQVEAMTLATRIAVMRAGKIQQIGTPSAVYDYPENLFVAGFLGAPSMNFITVQIHCDKASGKWRTSLPLMLELDNYKFGSEPEDGQNVVLGIRPEHIRLCADGAWFATVILLEPMGNFLTIWLDFNGIKLSVIVSESLDIQMDQLLNFNIDSTTMSIFDLATEQRL